MVVSIGGAKKKFADIVDELHMEPPMMSQFAVWLDMKLSEYKLQGDMRLDFHDSVSAPDWMKGSKCQCMERAQYGMMPRGKNAWMYSERESAVEMSRKMMSREGMEGRLLSPKQPLHTSDFDHDDLDEFADLDDPGQLDPDMAIDAQHPLVQLLSKKSKKKPTGTGRRGRPRGGKGITVTSTGVRVKRVKAKRKEPDSFPDMPDSCRDRPGQQNFPQQNRPQIPPIDQSSTVAKPAAKSDSSFDQKPTQEPNKEKPKQVVAPNVFPTTLPPNRPRPPSIPDLSDDELLDAFNENDDDDCSFDSATPPDSPDQRPSHPPGVPTSAPNVRQSFSVPHNVASSSQNFRPGSQGAQLSQGYYRGAYPPQRDAMGTPPSQSPRHMTTQQAQQFHQAQQQQQQHQHQASQQQHTAQQHQANPQQPQQPSSQQQGVASQGPPQQAPPQQAAGHPTAPTQTLPHPASSTGQSLPPVHSFSQSSQSPGGTALKLDRYRPALTTPQSLMREPESEDDFMDSMDSFNDEFYDDDFATDEEDIIALEPDEEASQLAMFGAMGSPTDSMPETASLPERLPGSQGPSSQNPRPVVSDPGIPAHTNLEDGSAPKKRKYNRKTDAIKVPKNVRLTVHNVVRDLKTQNPNLEWDYKKGFTDEWNEEMNSKIVALVENRIGQVDRDTCMKAINCYYVSRKAQWRKTQSGSTDDVKKKAKPAPKAEGTDSSQTPPAQSQPSAPQP